MRENYKWLKRYPRPVSETTVPSAMGKPPLVVL